MFYIITNGTPVEEAFSQGRYYKTPSLEVARLYADGMKRDTGKQYDVVKVEWVTTTQTLGEIMKEGRR